MKVLDQLVVACRTMNFAAATEECYRRWIEDYLRFHKVGDTWRHPNEMGHAEIG